MERRWTTPVLSHTSWSSESKTAVTKQKSHHEVTHKPKKTKGKQRKEESTITQCFGHVWSHMQTFIADFFFFGFSFGMSPSEDTGLSTSIPLSGAVTAILSSGTTGSGWGWGRGSLRSSRAGCFIQGGSIHSGRFKGCASRSYKKTTQQPIWTVKTPKYLALLKYTNLKSFSAWQSLWNHWNAYLQESGHSRDRSEVAKRTVAMASTYRKASVKRPALNSLQAYRILKV